MCARETRHQQQFTAQIFIVFVCVCVWTNKLKHRARSQCSHIWDSCCVQLACNPTQPNQTIHNVQYIDFIICLFACCILLCIFFFLRPPDTTRFLKKWKWSDRSRADAITRCTHICMVLYCIGSKLFLFLYFIFTPLNYNKAKRMQIN